ncbi:hypothetical protein [Streptomyces sp. NPDC049813]|uniref:hypothetical protein n=1 Tax=Streptomyces sp. NPDC049813 TaxID=3365597 RepID=UPI0037AAA031
MTRPSHPLARPLVRPMTAADCAAAAEVRVRGWQFAYAGLMPQPYLDAMDMTQDTARRHALLGRSPEFVAERAGVVVGGATVPELRYVRVLSS